MRRAVLLALCFAVSCATAQRPGPATPAVPKLVLAAEESGEERSVENDARFVQERIEFLPIKVQ